MKHFFAVVTASIVMSACATGGNSQESAAEPAGDQTPAFQEPIDYIPSALGPYSWKVTTSSEMAQKFFLINTSPLSLP